MRSYCARSFLENFLSPLFALAWIKCLKNKYIVTILFKMTNEKLISLQILNVVTRLVGMRETVTLYNKHNVPAQFFWTPVVGKDGTAFSVRPARGNACSYSWQSATWLNLIQFFFIIERTCF